MFALGSTCFLIGPFPGYAELVGESADAITFFVGSILFTAGGALQSRLAWSERHSPAGGGAAWWAAIVQSAGTLFFNVTTYQAMHTALTSPEYDRARLAARLARVDLLPRLGRDCLPRFGTSRVVARAWRRGLVAAGSEPARLRLLRNLRRRRLLVPSTGSMLDQAAANWSTSLGAACFLACALDTVLSEAPAQVA